MAKLSNDVTAKELHEKFGAPQELDCSYVCENGQFCIYASGYYSLPELLQLNTELLEANKVFPQYLESKRVYTIHTKAVDGGPFNCRPAMAHTLPACDILVNDVVTPGEYNPHNVRLWVIGNEFGPLCAAWGGYESEALDNAVDANKLDSLMADEQNHDDDSLTALGNASELFDLSYTWISEVDLSQKENAPLLEKFHSNNVENLKSQSLEY